MAEVNKYYGCDVACKRPIHKANFCCILFYLLVMMTMEIYQKLLTIILDTLAQKTLKILCRNVNYSLCIISPEYNFEF